MTKDQVIQALCLELDVENYTELHAKVREMKANQRKLQKDKRLVTNMKMLVKDTQANPMLSEVLKGGSTGDICSARGISCTTTNSMPGTLQNMTIDNTTLGNTIDHSTLPSDSNPTQKD